MNSDGTGKIQLTNTASANITPSFFPDGRIAFISTRDGQAEIYVMNSDGSNQIRMTFDGLYETPVISPEGKSIAYVRSSNIFIADIDMTNIRQLTTANVNTRISWSPDGEKIVFASGPDMSNLDIYTIYSDGTDMLQITSDTGSEDYPSFEFRPR
jgi:TolB protein